MRWKFQRWGPTKRAIPARSAFIQSCPGMNCSLVTSFRMRISHSNYMVQFFLQQPSRKHEFMRSFDFDGSIKFGTVHSAYRRKQSSTLKSFYSWYGNFVRLCCSPSSKCDVYEQARLLHAVCVTYGFARGSGRLVRLVNSCFCWSS